MPRYVLKPDPEDDLYVVWSTVVDNCVAVGDREQVTALFVQAAVEDATRELEGTFERCDRTGTSLRDGTDGWEDRDGGGHLFMANVDRRPEFSYGTWHLPLAALKEYAERLCDGDKAGAEALLVEEDAE